MPSKIIISASDDGYLPLLLDMIESLGAENLQKYALGIRDLGLSESGKEQIHKLKPDAIIKTPEWYIDHPAKDVFNLSASSRPFLKETFPGYDGYIYIDADVWLADPSAIDDYIKAAKQSGMSIASESHVLLPSYFKVLHTKIFGKTIMRRVKPSAYSYGVLKNLFGREEALQFGSKPAINDGLFYIKNDSPVWKAWQETMQGINWYKVKKKQRVCDQTCLLYALYKHDLPFMQLSMHYNWLLSAENVPLLDEKTGELLDPIYPHTPIKVIHLIAGAHRRGFKIPTTDGKEIDTKLTYSAFSSLR